MKGILINELDSIEYDYELIKNIFNLQEWLKKLLKLNIWNLNFCWNIYYILIYYYYYYFKIIILQSFMYNIIFF